MVFGNFIRDHQGITIIQPLEGFEHPVAVFNRFLSAGTSAQQEGEQQKYRELFHPYRIVFNGWTNVGRI
jgi:hypothetical protein